MIGAFVEQRSTEWHEQRAKLITASEASAALGLSQYKTVDEYVHQKVLALSGAEPEFKGNKFTRWGNEREEYVKGLVEHDQNVFIAEAQLTVHPEHEWLGASPDGIISKTRGVEIKCPFADIFKEWEAGTADQDALRQKCEERMFTAADKIDYWVQMQIQMACCGFDEVLFCVWTPLNLHTEIVQRDDAWLEANLPKLKLVHDRIMDEFCSADMRSRHLENSQAHTQDQDVLHIAQMYALQYERTKQMQEQLQRIKDRLIDAMKAANESEVETPEVKAKRMIRRGKLNSSALQKAAQEHGIDVEQFRGEEEEAWTVTIKKNRE